ncbi:MAG TPA: hypothetical protein VKU19_16460 [Bryobacteraceae bacterium]|nr:hypothetical protein [Bryobacteraceae bacterium]
MRNSYFLNVTGPLDSKVFQTLEHRVRDYIGSGRTEEEALDWAEAVASVRKTITARPITPDIQSVIDGVAADRVRLTIKAIQGGNKIVLFSGISSAARVPNSNELAANVDATLDHSISYVLKEKLPRMANVQGYDRKVLLVWKAIPTGTAENVGAVFASKLKIELDGVFLYEYGANRTTLVVNAGLLPAV